MVTLLYVGGGMTFPDHTSFLDYLRERDISLESDEKWSDRLDELPAEFLRPALPCKENAHYDAWAITFMRYLELVDDVILVGNSLGGIFLARFLSENEVPCRVRAVFLVAPPFDDTLSSEPLTNGFVLDDLSDLASYNPTLFFSQNDTIVPIEHAEKYRQALPESEIIILDAADHFIQPEFPELFERIRSIIG